MRRRPAPARARRTTIAAATTLAALAGCTLGEDSEPPPSVVTTTTQPAPRQTSDGMLTIGALIPSGDSAVGGALTESIESAIAAVNEAGGVLGNDVEFRIIEEGQSAATASQAIEELVEQDNIDALIGPTSSNIAIGALDEAVADGIVTCSATATAIGLDDYPDEDRFFRTIATDSLQAVAIAREAQATGAERVVIVYVDDAYGRPYAEAVTAALGDLVTVQPIPVAVDDDDLTDDLDAIQAGDRDALVILANGDDIARFLEAMGQRDDIDVPNIFVNDDARNASSRAAVAALDPSIRERILVVAPEITHRDDDEGVPFGPQIVDCVNLIALSAVQGQSDSPEVIAQQMVSVSGGGEGCDDYASCLDRITAGDDINYDGPTGITALGSNGDPSRAFFEILGFAPDGADDFIRRLSYQA